MGPDRGMPEAGAAYRDGMEGSQERAELAARTGGMSAHLATIR